jgi:hypothetical protein
VVIKSRVRVPVLCLAEPTLNRLGQNALLGSDGNGLVIVDVQEMERALEEFKAAVKRGKTVGEISRGLINE